MQWHERGPERLGYTARDFKVCDFCGALNPVHNDECFVCSWRGRFHDDKETVMEAMQTLEFEYGEIEESLFEEEVVPSTLPKQSLWTAMWDSIKRLFSRA